MEQAEALRDAERQAAAARVQARQVGLSSEGLLDCAAPCACRTCWYNLSCVAVSLQARLVTGRVLSTASCARVGLQSYGCRGAVHAWRQAAEAAASAAATDVAARRAAALASLRACTDDVFTLYQRVRSS